LSFLLPDVFLSSGFLFSNQEILSPTRQMRRKPSAVTCGALSGAKPFFATVSCSLLYGFPSSPFRFFCPSHVIRGSVHSPCAVSFLFNRPPDQFSSLSNPIFSLLRCPSRLLDGPGRDSLITRDLSFFVARAILLPFFPGPTIPLCLSKVTYSITPFRCSPRRGCGSTRMTVVIVEWAMRPLFFFFTR